MALTTLANVKLMLGISGSAQDAQITALINVASARIESWCNRKFEAKDCIEWQDGGKAVVCKRAPVNSILRIGIMDGSYFLATYSGPDVWARVDVRAGLNGDVGSLRLSSASSTAVIITFDNKTVADVVAAINGIANWSASFNGQTINGKAAWIPPCAGLDAANGSAIVPICMGELATARYEADSGVIELTGDGQWSGAQFFGASNFAIGNQSFGGMSFGVVNTWPSLGNPGLSFPKVYQGIVVDYNGGMTPIPADIEQTCVDMVQYMIQQGANTAMLLQSESLGGYAWTAPGGGIANALGGLDDLMRDRLAGYTRFALAI